MQNDGLPHYTPTYPSTKGFKESMPLAGPLTPPTPPRPVNNTMLLGPENTVTTCQFCNASIRTAVKYTTTSRTHIAAALWGLLCCLCCVPYGSDSAKNSDHYCPSCEKYLGTYYK